MARRRYISTEVSTDPRVNRVAVRSDFAALLYTWLIPHAQDDATVTGDPEKLLMEVVPGRRDKTAQDIVAALQIIEEEGLFEAWDRDEGIIYLPVESFYSYQTYIKADNRRSTPKNSGKRRRTPKNAASLSLSLSPSLSKDKPFVAKAGEKVHDDIPESVIGYWTGKAGREAKPADLASLAAIVDECGAERTAYAIGQACAQGEAPDSYGLIRTIARKAVAS